MTLGLLYSKHYTKTFLSNFLQKKQS